MLRFNTIEDAIMKLNRLSFKMSNKRLASNKIKLARFDYAPVQTLATQAATGIPYTSKQKQFAVTLITKYSKQWKKQGFEVGNITMDTETRRPLRIVDSNKTIDVDETRTMITLRFPYDPNLVSRLYNYAEQESAGLFDWNKEDECWEIDVTPEHVAYISTLAINSEFDISPAFASLDSMMQNVFDFRSICLDIEDGEVTLHNAPASMLEWIEDEVGEVNIYNLNKLVSMSDSLLFSLSRNVLDQMSREHGEFAPVVACRNSWVKDIEQLPYIIDKLYELDYKEVIVYTAEGDHLNNDLDGTDSTNGLNNIRNLLERCPVFNLYVDINSPSGLHKVTEYKTDRKLIMTNKVMALMPDAIISLVGFTIGPQRKEWFRSAKKNIYVCPAVNDKIKKISAKNERKFSNQ